MKRTVLTIIFLTFNSSLSISDECQDWFKNLELKKDENCLLSCLSAPTGMGSFICTKRCKEFCKPDENKKIVVNVISQGTDVVVQYSDGTLETRTGGSRSWRNNNPGNLRMSGFSKNNGAIGEAGGFSVFPDEKTGNKALSNLLHTDPYRNLTINGVISRYACPDENDTKNYQDFLERVTGLSGNTNMNTLNNKQFDSVVGAIRKMEGWNTGTIKTERK
jgi:hypothetical protein